MKNRFLIPFFLLPFVSPVLAQSGSRQVKNPFMPPPGTSASIFAPGMVSDEFGNRDFALAPDGLSFYYTLQYKNGLFSTILYSRKKKGKWTRPEVAGFSGRYSDLEPAFSPDGRRLYFVSNRPLDPTGNKKDYNIWFVSLEEGRWSQPEALPFPVNTDANEFYPSVSKNGNIYFTRVMEGQDEDIVLCRRQDNQYLPAVSLPGTINSTGAEFNAFVDPEEAYVLFTAYRREGNLGQGDLYISYRDAGGNWSEAMNLGNKVNGPGLTYCPYVTADKKYLFFSTARGAFAPPFPTAQSLDKLRTLFHSTQNGWDNIYWIGTEGIVKD
ncbi:MAG TPA: hypothetical protein PKM27_14330 [Saprospiraceae bacterium]|nr:hypothetical protein [Saprospiraceae bacterium]HNT22132.1 hypothetical protein [Saprospiraceae bacterium]